MTVEKETTTVVYEGNNSTRIFPVPFAFMEDAHVAAVLRRPVGASGSEEVVLVFGADFSLTGSGKTQGGSLSYPLTGMPLQPGEFLGIYSAVPITQTTHWSNGDIIDVKEIEKANDKLTRICRQLKEELNRCIKTDITEDIASGSLLTALREVLNEALATSHLAEEKMQEASEIAALSMEAASRTAQPQSVSFIRGNTAGDAWEYRTDTEVASLLELQGLVSRHSGNTFTRAQGFAMQTLAPDPVVQWDCTHAPLASIHARQDCIIDNPLNPVSGHMYMLKIVPDECLISWGSDYNFGSRRVPDITSTSYLTFLYDANLTKPMVATTFQEGA